MEEKTPTMPSVVFLKYLKVTGEGVDSQGKFAYATCDEIELPGLFVIKCGHVPFPE